MPAPAKYPTPPAQLLVLAIRARAGSDPFVEFWLSAIRPGKSPPITIKTPPASRPVGAVVWPRDSYDRSVWQEAMYSAEEGWKRAYEGLPPTRAERALAVLGPELRVTTAKATALLATEGIDLRVAVPSAA